MPLFYCTKGRFKGDNYPIFIFIKSVQILIQKNLT